MFKVVKSVTQFNSEHTSKRDALLDIDTFNDALQFALIMADEHVERILCSPAENLMTGYVLFTSNGSRVAYTVEHQSSLT
jgi:hypothetical protein